jgi:hypothetical protein
MMTGGYTKETIASALEVLAGGDVTVKISSNGVFHILKWIQ